MNDNFYDVFGRTVYASRQGEVTDEQLLAAFRQEVPTLIETDPDFYRTTREFVIPSGRLVFCVATGQKRDGSLWWGVMAVGGSVKPPPEYASISHAVGEAAIMRAVAEGDFD